jgi:hypothetical protein
MFPRGWPGVALLLLRASVVSALLFQDFGNWQELSILIHGSVALLAVALSAGYQTPFAAVMAVVFHWLVATQLGIGSVADLTIVTLDAMALAMLGPGGYSIDSYRFGRRVLVLPPP